MISEKEIVEVLQNLAETQTKATIKAVKKRGLLNTTWNDIDKEGGRLDFEVIAHAIVKKIEDKENSRKNS